MHCTIASPIGDLILVWNDQQVVTELRLPGSSESSGGEPIGPSGKAAELADRLVRYFSGEEVVFSAELFVMPGETPFFRQVYEHIYRIPPGRTETYGQIASQLGKPGAARAVGQAMATNPLPIIVPCHRVLSATGLGGFSSGLDHKRYLLRLEGVLLDLS